MVRALFPRVLSRILIATTYVALTAGGADAQGTITGRVLAQGTNEPLPDARVLALGTNSSATSAQDGKYTLTNLRSGTVEVQVLRMRCGGPTAAPQYRSLPGSMLA